MRGRQQRDVITLSEALEVISDLFLCSRMEKCLRLLDCEDHTSPRVLGDVTQHRQEKTASDPCPFLLKPRLRAVNKRDPGAADGLVDTEDTRFKLDVLDFGD